MAMLRSYEPFAETAADRGTGGRREPHGRGTGGERAGRLIDGDRGDSMEAKKSEGYF